MSKKLPFALLAIFLITSPVFAQETYNIQLKAGDNLIALPLIPQDTNISNILFPIITQVKDVWEFNPADVNDPWKHYRPGLEDYSDLNQMDAGKGYWINVKTNVTLQITGTPVPENSLVNLKKGWNIIGWPYQYSHGITTAFCALTFGTDYNQVSRFNSTTKTQENFLNQPASDDFTDFEPGKTYYIYMLQDMVISIGVPTVEQVLQKVSDNSRLIEDLKADMTISTILDSQPLGEEGYYIYYFKKPKKEKIETYSSSDRGNKIDVTIIDGPTMYLVNPITKEVQSIDLLAKSSIDSAQFNQMDICYNLSEFLNGHTVTKNEGDSDLINFIMAIEAVPRTENPLYTKLELFIDYKKGLLIKSLLFKDSSLREKMEVQESQLMPNEAWVPVKMIKVPMLTSGNLISTLTYSDIQINVGLTDDVFDPTKQ